MTLDDEEQQSPFTRPGFIAAALIVAVVAVLGVVLAIANMNRDDEATTAPPPTARGSSSEPSATETTIAAPVSDASVCGLAGEVLSGTLTTAPAADWKFHGAIAYPTSTTHGPGKKDPAGFHYCFQHSPEGALFAATYAATVAGDPTVVPAWVQYFAAPGRHRDELIQEAGAPEQTADIRFRVVGFRQLSYDGEAASIDVAMVASIQGQNVTMSAVYPLVWADGDWKLNTDTSTPGSVVSIPDLTGYTVWEQ
ncbi:hypothetical protein [Sanguibacter massiliensis]|uniref:hypothetical protein n=1 Tax=Sanguibacter massiliensis TaxID=1973217 RepID=UPI000C82FB27|nr:hypothetical protein [Sanguibacter massiliensis]